MTYGHGSGLPPYEAPVIIAEKRKLFFFFSFCLASDVLGIGLVKHLR